MKTRVVFVCTRNSCRSQMAEAFARALAFDVLDAYSAGLEPGKVDPRVVAVMHEVGINIEHQQPKLISSDMLRSGTVLVTLCKEAEDGCPVPSPGVSRIFWPLEDPSSLQGDSPEIMAQVP